ncbi:transporter substrate-binding domain-containing protein [Moraxella sp. K127]|nr:transporter substrate-binding domain-containing protein [Moraxella sp. K127]
MKHTVFFNQGVMIGVICIIGLLSACDKKQSTTQNTDDTNISTKTIQVAVNSNMPPFAYIDDRGNPIGFDVEVITHIAQKMDTRSNLIFYHGKICSNQ